MKENPDKTFANRGKREIFEKPSRQIEKRALDSFKKSEEDAFRERNLSQNPRISKLPKRFDIEQDGPSLCIIQCKSWGCISECMGLTAAGFQNVWGRQTLRRSTRVPTNTYSDQPTATSRPSSLSGEVTKRRRYRPQGEIPKRPRRLRRWTRSLNGGAPPSSGW